MQARPFPSDAAALVVAAGRGTRAGGALPKQYQPLGAHQVLTQTLAALLAMPQIDRIQVVIHPDDHGLYAQAIAPLPRERLLAPVEGGASRAASVRAGLEALTDAPPAQVLIHDAARPFPPEAMIAALLDALKEAQAACPALPVVDALWHAAGAHLDTPQPRAGLWRAQTPQAFAFETILHAHRTHSGDAPDDVTLARACGIAVVRVPGSEDNFKLTLPEDFARAEAMMERR